ncbi:unnamed protein product, partial [Pylaiella littoralis]
AVAVRGEERQRKRWRINFHHVCSGRQSPPFGVCGFLPTGGHRGGMSTQEEHSFLFSTFFLRCLPLFFSRKGFGHLLPPSTFSSRNSDTTETVSYGSVIWSCVFSPVVP